MSIFCVFSANIPFASNNSPFLGVKILNYLYMSCDSLFLLLAFVY